MKQKIAKIKELIAKFKKLIAIISAIITILTTAAYQIYDKISAELIDAGVVIERDKYIK